MLSFTGMAYAEDKSPQEIEDPDVLDDDEDRSTSPALRGGLGPVPVLLPSASGGGELPVEEVPRWSLPPTPWRAALTFSGMAAESATGASATSMREQLTASGNSYVWQPWFLKLIGSTSLFQSQEGAGKSSGQSFGLSGNLLPVSRFPFSFSGNVASSDSRQGDAQSEIRNTSLGLSQGYTPPNRAYTSSMYYNWLSAGGQVSSGSGGATPSIRTSAQNAGISVAVPLFTENPQSVNFSAALGRTNNSLGQASGGNGSMSGDHAIYLEDYVMNIATNFMANMVRVTADGQSARSATSSLSTTMSWIPSDDYPLDIGANAAIFNNKTEVAGLAGQGSSSSAAGTARYRLDSHWDFSFMAYVNQFKSEANGAADERQVHSLSGSVNWGADGYKTKLSEWDYSFGMGGGVGFGYFGASGSSGDNGDSQGSLRFTLSQAVSRSYINGSTSPIFVSISQSYGGGVDGVGGGGHHSLSHSLAADWSPSTESASKSFFASVSDGRSFVKTGGTAYQQARLGARYQTATSVYSVLSADISGAYSSQQGSQGGRSVAGMNAGTNYSHARFGNISGLYYAARYSLSAQKQVEAGAGYLLTHNFDQSWSWRYGLLGWQVNHSVHSEPNMGVAQSLTFSVVRDFSGVL